MLQLRNPGDLAWPFRRNAQTHTVLEQAAVLSAAWGTEPPVESEVLLTYPLGAVHEDGLLAVAEHPDHEIAPPEEGGGLDP